GPRPRRRRHHDAARRAGRAARGGGGRFAMSNAARLAPVDPAALEAAAASLAERCPGRVRRAFPLAGLTTFRLGGPAALFLRAETHDDLAALAAVLAGVPLPLLVIGRGP